MLSGERYKTISKEAAGILKGEYGATPAPVNAELQQKVLSGGQVITCRPADLIEPEMESLTAELVQIAKEEDIQLAEDIVDDVLIYAQFHQVGLTFLKNRGNNEFFEPVPTAQDKASKPAPNSTSSVNSGQAENYQVMVDGRTFDVVVAPGDGSLTQIQPVVPEENTQANSLTVIESIQAPLAGSVLEVKVAPGDHVEADQEVMFIEAMKMEVQIRSACAGTISNVFVEKGDSVVVDQALITIG